jgi:hypothetical protein
MSTDLACAACGKERIDTTAEYATGLCVQCARQLGLPVRIGDLRPPTPCTRCKHDTFVRAVLRERRVDPGEIGPGFTGEVAPMAVSFGLQKHWGGWAMTADVDYGMGVLVAYICQGCGLTELYTAGFQHLPIGPQFGTELVKVGGTDPFR